jgi:hypothetical protein
MDIYFKNLVKTNGNGLSLYVTTETSFGDVVVTFVIEVANPVVNVTKTFKDYTRALNYYNNLDA